MVKVQLDLTAKQMRDTEKVANDILEKMDIDPKSYWYEKQLDIINSHLGDVLKVIDEAEKILEEENEEAESEEETKEEIIEEEEPYEFD
ncbi:hypothetical protein [Hutsoniella sourekii]|uniref:hypothetical protein n=1 Tax=Hutsoniella sourekii TaxID=87650 RepID=UPI0004844FA1|nr:hypothetical protein [Hutsoniella sourekii]